MYRNIGKLKFNPNRDASSGTKSGRIAKAIAVAANKAGISHNEGERIVEHVFIWMKRWMCHYSMPKIRIMYFGEFSPSLTAINRSIRYRFTMLRKTNYQMRRYFKLLFFIARYWPIRDRLIRENRGEITYNEWFRKEDWMEIRSSEIFKRKREWRMTLRLRREQIYCDMMETCQRMEQAVMYANLTE